MSRPTKAAQGAKVRAMKDQIGRAIVIPQLSKAEAAARSRRENAPIPANLVDAERQRLYGVMDTLEALGRMAELCLNTDAAEDDYEALAIVTRGMAGQARGTLVDIANALDRKSIDAAKATT